MRRGTTVYIMALPSLVWKPFWEPVDSPLLWSLYVLRLFVSFSVDGWLLLPYSLCASVTCSSTYRCLHTSTLPLSHSCPPAVGTVALLFLPLCPMKHMCSHSQSGSPQHVTPIMWPRLFRWLHLHSYFHTMILTIRCFLEPRTRVFWESGAPGGTGVPSPTQSHQNRWLWLGWTAWMNPHCLWM